MRQEGQGRSQDEDREEDHIWSRGCASIYMLLDLGNEGDR